MENTKQTGFSEINEIYEALSPLDRSREIYLLATVFREELGLSPSWSYELEQAQRDYARRIGDSVNSDIQDSTNSEGIEDAMVHHIISETQRRWFAYTECIESNSKVDEFIELLPNEPTVTCSLEQKAEQVRNSWRTFLEDYGVRGAEFSPVVRAEFLSNKTIWDTTKESRFLQKVLTYEQQEEVAA